MASQEITQSAHSCRAHIVQFYHDERYLIGAVAEFLRQGLDEKEAMIVLCTENHWKQIEAEMMQSHSFFLVARNTGQLKFVSAHEVLGKILDSNQALNLKLFEEILDQAQTGVPTSFKAIRFYGDLVDLLLAQGLITQALELEKFWHDYLLCHHNICLFCGYCKKNIPNTAAGEQISTGHSNVIPEEDFKSLGNSDALYRRIATLELKIAIQNLEQKDQNHELKQIKAQLVQMRKLSVLGELCASLAHELNNPLAIVAGLADQITEANENDRADIPKWSASIHTASDRMAKIIKNVLRLAHQEPIEKKAVLVQEPIQSAIELSKYSLSSLKIELKLNLVSNELYCLGDSNLLCQVFMNLISNARDAIQSAQQTKGCVEITAQATADNKIDVTITDNGTGMDQKTQERIFLPFFTTKESGKGTGLGLSISHTALQEHGGQIICQSVLGQGTSFHIILPRADSPASNS